MSFNDSGMEKRFERFSGLEEDFDPQAHGATAARIRPSRQFVEVKPVAVEPVRLQPAREPLTDEEAEQIMADWAWREEQGRHEDLCGLEGDEVELLSINEQKAWEIEHAWDQHLGTSTAGADLYH